MTEQEAKEAILAKPILAQRIMRAYMVKLAEGEDDAKSEETIFERACMALGWWDGQVREAQDIVPEITEAAFAGELYRRLKKQTRWGEIFKRVHGDLQ